jgi:putative oxidoreductase
MNTNKQAPLAGWGTAFLRWVVGVVFLMHGGQKLFTYGFHGVAGTMQHLGIPLPMVSAVVVTLVEFFGGLALVLGLGTRFAAALLTVNMLVAVLKVHLKNGFFLPQGFEYALSLLVANLSLVLTGPGKAALGNVFGHRKG